jgi:hypothetical protein
MNVDAVPVRFGGASESSVTQGVARSVSTVLHGVLRLADDLVVLEWSGTRTFSEAGRGNVRSVTEPVAVGRAVFSVASLTRVAVRRRWWRTRIELVSSDLTALATVPTATGGRLTLAVARSDRHAAADLVSRIELAAADHAIAAAERRRALPEAAPPPGE